MRLNTAITGKQQSGSQKPFLKLGAAENSDSSFGTCSVVSALPSVYGSDARVLLDVSDFHVGGSDLPE
ncbi:MAG: hypothetical protein JSS02_10040 [Planctomycetes bacterium]|nr:hypothetical protein [Planctomycetota bacterium]